MLTFLTGTYFPAKKEYIYDKICTLLKNGERVYLIVPEQASFDRDRDFLLKYGEKLSNLLTVTSFTHLSRDVLEENGLRVKPEADEAARAVIMSLAVEDCYERLDVYRRHSGKLLLVQELLREYSEIKSAGLDTERLLKVSGQLPDSILKKKTAELGEIFSAYEAALSTRFSESSDNIRVMRDFLSSNKIFDGAHIFFDDFRGFTGAQIKLMEEMISQAENAYISVFAPDSVNSYDSGAFSHAVRNCRAIRNSVSERGVMCTEESISARHPDGAVAALSDSLFCVEKDSYGEDTGSVQIISARDKYEECTAAAYNIRRLIQEKGYRCRDISVTERGNGYVKILSDMLKKYGIPVFEDKRVPLFQYPLVKMLLSAVSIAAFGFTTEEMFTYIKSGVSGIDDDSCSELENYVYVWQIDRNSWTKPFTGHPDGYGEQESEKTAERLRRINSTREKSVAPILRLKHKLEGNDGALSCRALFEFLTETEASSNFLSYAAYLNENVSEAAAVECSAVWDFVISSLDALYAAVNGRKISPKRFYELLKIILSSGDIGRIPAGIDEIVIGQAGRTRHLEPKAVFVLGCNESVFPAPPVSGGLFTSSERRILINNEFPLENIPENMYAEERMIAYNVLVNTGEMLFVSYSRNTSGGAALQPSEIIREIKEIIPSAATLDASALTSLEKIGSEETAFEECAVNYHSNSVFSETLKKYVSESSLSHKFEAVKSAADESPAELYNKENAAALFGRDMYISPSRAEVYHSCAFKYFCQYGLGIKKLRPADLDARINGLLIHHLLEKILIRKTNSELVSVSENELSEMISSITEEFITEYMGGRDDKSILLNRSLDKTKKTAFDILSRMIKEFSVSRFMTVAVELDIRYGGDIEPYKISLPDGGSITVGGKVDRVDIMEDGGKAYLRVVDYKTGGKDFKLSDVFSGLNMQMLIYLMCLWDNGKEKYGDIVPAGILYVPANNSGDQLSRHATDDEIEKQKLRNGRMNGMILEDGNVLDGMEKGCCGIFLDAKIDDKGRMKGNFLPLSGFKSLHGKIDEILSDMGTSLHNGRIEALPVIGKSSYKYTCDYCDYQDVCRRSDYSPSKSPLGLSHEKAAELLKGSD